LRRIHAGYDQTLPNPAVQRLLRGVTFNSAQTTAFSLLILTIQQPFSFPTRRLSPTEFREKVPTMPLGLQAYNTRCYQASQLNTLDPSGELIGPNGDGDTSDVKINTYKIYESISELGDGSIVTAQFQTVAEPSSIVLAASGALLISTVAFGTSCPGRHLQSRLP
jgi:hypothetical protein